LIRASDYLHKEETVKAFSSIHSTILDRPNLTTYFVWCLTDDELIRDSAGDRLSQWRGYSRGKQAFSLGFDYDILQTSFSARQELLRFNIRPCGYDDADQNAALRKIAERHFQPMIHGINSAIQQMRNQDSISESARKYFLSPLLAMYMDFVEPAAFMKHPGFSEEREWRCVFLAKDNSECSFRESNFGLTPYLEIEPSLNSSPSPLKRIVVGPGPHKDEWVTTVNLMLAKCSITGVEIVPSQIPYRNW
jgi:hypothetical protein